MYSTEKSLSISELLEQMAQSHKREKISLGEIKEAMHERGFAFLFIVFSLPLLIPLPVPTGLGTALSIPLFFFAYQLTMNVDSPWLPKWVLNKELNSSTFRKIVQKSNPILKFIEKFLRKRLVGLAVNRKYEIFTGIFIMLLNIPIMVPFPLSNTLPAVSIVIISFGMIERDGLMMIVGQLVGIISWLVCIIIGVAIYYGANEAVKFVPESLRDDFHKLKESIEPEIREYKQYLDIDGVHDNDADYKPVPSYNKSDEPHQKAK